MDMEQRDYDSRTALHVAAAEGKSNLGHIQGNTTSWLAQVLRACFAVAKLKGVKKLGTLFECDADCVCVCVFQDMLRWFVSFWRPVRSTQFPETGNILEPNTFRCGSEEFAGPGSPH